MTTAYFDLSAGDLVQDWTGTDQITTANDWSGVPSIMGFKVDNSAATGTDPRTVLDDTGFVANVVANQTATANTGGVLEIGGANPTIAFQGSGSADFVAIALYLNATGREHVTLSANLRDLDAGADDAAQQVAVQYRIGSSGSWTNIAYVADATTAGSATQVTPISVELPAAAANQPELQIRFVTTNAAGNDELVGVDDIQVTSTAISADPVPGTLSIADASLTEGDSGTPMMEFTVTRAGGDDGAVSATWTLDLGGSADAADLGTATLTGTVSFADGQTSATISIPVQGDTVVEPDEGFTVTLSDPTGGAGLGDAVATGTILNDDTDAPPVPGELSITDASATEGDSGATDIVFTVTRADGSDGAVSATWTVSFPGGTDGANSGDFAGGTVFTGTVDFADGATSATITLPIAGDAGIEPDELFTITLSDPTGGASLGDAQATGTIADDDTPVPLANVFINEFHYDDASTDTGEAIEVAGTAGTNLAGWSLVLYNGSNGSSNAITYGSPIALSGVIADQANGFGTVSVPAVGLQNGAADGIALVDSEGRVVQFLSYEGVITASNGPAAGMTSTDTGVAEEPAPADGHSLQLTGSGSSAADFSWALVADDSFGAVNAGQTFYSPTGTAHLRVGDASVTEGDAGTVALTFTVYRAGGTALEASVDYVIDLDGTADAADLSAGTVFAGTVAFAAGETQKQVTIQVQGDTLSEGNETLGITLSNPVGDAVIDDATGIGTIVNNDPIALSIGQIQGAAHQSAYVGQPVTTTGIVTAVDTNGFYLQSAIGDGNAATSDAIFVFTSTAPTVAVGDDVSVSGSVAEFAGSAVGLTLTQIVSPTVSVISTGNPLPAALLIGTGGVLPPTEAIDDDGMTSYDPLSDGIDFWESLEGMRVTIDAPIVVSNTNGFGETDVVASGGAGATGINDRGGITVSAGDFNPEKIQIDDDSGVFAGFAPGYSIGDVLGSVTGVVNYAFNAYEVVVTEAVAVTQDAVLADNDTTLEGDADHLSLATYNLENLDPGDGKYDLFAHDIIYSLGAPDILAVQEIQDADGAGSGGDLSGTVTAQGLIDAIALAGGPTYVYVEIAPGTAGSTGGEPGGNIRNGYFYNPDRVDYVAGSAELVPGAAYNNSRSPLAATWMFNGEALTTINVHFTSRIGSDPLWGNAQPPADAGDGSRIAQAATVLAYVNDALATDPSLNMAVLGDFNGFYFEDFQTQLTEGGVLTNLSTLLPEEERYSYLFEGNAQLIDNILVTGGIVTGASYDAVHINSQFAAGASRPTDHDPQVSLLYMPGAPTNLLLASPQVDENAPAGTAVGTLSADDSDALTYSLVDDAGGRFAIDSVTGVITTTASFDHETNASFVITGRATDAGGHSIEGNFTVQVGNVNEAPVLAGPTIAAIVKVVNDPAIPLLQGVSVADPDASLSLANGGFTLDVSGTDGAIEIAAGSGFALAGAAIVETATGNTIGTIAGLGTGSVTVSGLTADATPALVTALLQAFTFDVVDSEPASTRTVTLVFDDGGIGGSGPLTDSVTQTLAIGYNYVAGTGAGETLIGGAASDLLAGRDGDDTLKGGRGTDRLDGGTGADRLYGGAGDDTYLVESLGDRAYEQANEGTDTVLSGVSYSLAGQHIETLVLTGSAAIDGTGNGLANHLVGNSGINQLKGGAGNDSYVVQTAGDRVFEKDGEGVDTVESSVSYALAGQSVENLTLTGAAAINGSGNALTNAITGNAGANKLTGHDGNDRIDGGAGADKLYGGAGDDSYVVDDIGDQVLEAVGEGHDGVESSVSYALGGQAVEDLTLTGVAAINGTGNHLDNAITGNGAANRLIGGRGNDMMTGGGGGDSFWFNTALDAATNVDTITDFAVGSDTIVLDRSIFGALGFGDFPAAAFTTGSAAQDANDRIIYDSLTGALYYDADGTGAAAAIQFATLTPGLGLSASDFAAVA